MRPRGDRAGTEVIGRIDWPHIMEGNWPALVSFARVRPGRGRGGEFEIGGRHEDLRRRHAALLRRHLQRSHIRPPIGHIGAPPKLNPREDPVRSSIGLAGQFAAVEPAMTGRENLEMVARLFGEDRARARGNSSRVVEQIGLVEDADRLVRTYSGGMRRKLDLGANPVGTPRLLLLDEPTTGVDPRSRIDLWDAMRGLVKQGTNVLLTTQYLDEADHLADEIVVIDHGRTIA
jgi:ABC-type transport system involved in cytochrome c biogenesis ATPase subunit